MKFFPSQFGERVAGAASGYYREHCQSRDGNQVSVSKWKSFEYVSARHDSVIDDSRCSSFVNESKPVCMIMFTPEHFCSKLGYTTPSKGSLVTAWFRLQH